MIKTTERKLYLSYQNRSRFEKLILNVYGRLVWCFTSAEDKKLVINGLIQGALERGYTNATTDGGLNMAAGAAYCALEGLIREGEIVEVLRFARAEDLAYITAITDYSKAFDVTYAHAKEIVDRTLEAYSRCIDYNKITVLNLLIAEIPTMVENAKKV